MAISPMFRERFQQALYDKLESVHRHQTTSSIDQNTLLQQQQQQQQPIETTPDLVEQALVQDVFNDIQNWIH